jgi:hypothetical protein
VRYVAEVRRECYVPGALQPEALVWHDVDPDQSSRSTGRGLEGYLSFDNRRTEAGTVTVRFRATIERAIDDCLDQTVSPIWAPK